MNAKTNLLAKIVLTFTLVAWVSGSVAVAASGRKARDTRAKKELEAITRATTQAQQSKEHGELRRRFSGIGRSFERSELDAEYFETALVSGVMTRRFSIGHVDAISRRHEPVSVRSALAAYLIARAPKSRYGLFDPVGHHVEHLGCDSEHWESDCLRQISPELECMFSVWVNHEFTPDDELAWEHFIRAEEQLLRTPPSPQLNSLAGSAERKIQPPSWGNEQGHDSNAGIYSRPIPSPLRPFPDTDACSEIIRQATASHR